MVWYGGMLRNTWLVDGDEVDLDWTEWTQYYLSTDLSAIKLLCVDTLR